MLLWTFIDKVLSGHRFSFLLVRLEGLDLLDNMMTFWGNATLLSKVAALFYFFFFLICIYLAALHLSCSMQDLWSSLQCVGSSVAACGIFSCGMWGVVPWTEIEPGHPALGVWSLSHWTTRVVHIYSFQQALYEGFNLSMYLPTLVVMSFLFAWS